MTELWYYQSPLARMQAQMSTALARRSSGKLARRSSSDAVATWVAQLEPHTRRAYETGLRSFATYLADGDEIEEPTIDAAGTYLLGLDARKANELVQEYINELARVDRKTRKPRYTRGTIGNRVSALRWAVREARRFGYVDWSLEVVVPKLKKDRAGRLVRKAGRDMKGPPEAIIAQMVAAAFSSSDPRAALVLSLCYTETLRSHEIRQPNLDELDLETGTIIVVRKKRVGPEAVPLSPLTQRAAKRWLRVRGRRPGPLLLGGCDWTSRRVPDWIRGLSDKKFDELRISASGISRIVRRLGREGGVETSPHRIRHTGITVGDAAAELLNIPKQDRKGRSGHIDDKAYAIYLDQDTANVRVLTDAVAARIEELIEIP